jgi:hypothetical protein
MRRTSAIRERAAKYLASCEPDALLYARYLDAGRKLIEGPCGGVLRLRFKTTNVAGFARISQRRSLLFKRDYFIAWLPDDAFARSHPPATDASAEVHWNETRPPLVLAPERNRSDRNARFTSILEHEIVHINQLLSHHDTPPRRRRANAAQLLADHFCHTRLEYVANFVQGVHWPSMVRDLHRRWGITLEQWSLLRGYTQALEHLLFDLMHEETVSSGTALAGFLTAVPAAAPDGLAPLELSPEALEWFRSRWRDDVVRAPSA